MQSTRSTNRLINEKSPYLLQHAHNPVNWFPWGEEAFAASRGQDKPIFLSIGYSTCHWCHVMERESFEDESIAAVMNEMYVCIKVDREERPDVDKVYMAALQAMGQNGGWPMSMFLTPELKPFYGGTYFPPTNRYGRIGFPDLLRRISDVWKNERSKVVESADGVINFLENNSRQPAGTLDASLLTSCFDQAVRSYDSQFGGFGGAPKFPRPAVFSFFLRYFHRTREPMALEMTEKTLRSMSNGGMYDHIGGGFHRYSVDSEWRVPHFEKMLYDQAQIVCSLVDVFRVKRDPLVEGTIRETLDYVLRDLTDRDGGFYSAEDADSQLPDSPDEKGEGAFYTWSKEEIHRALGNDAKAFCFRYGVEEAGNALSDPQQEFVGKNILYCAESLEETTKFLGSTKDETRALLHHAKQKLFSVREKRPRPHLDDKIITAWNGLMISAFARAAQALNEPTYLRAAERAAGFVMNALYHESSGTLHRRYRDGEAMFEAHLDDYAFLTQGLIDLYETSFEWRWLRSALVLTQKQIELFWDDRNGGFFDTSGKDSSILVRMKDQHDGAEPTGNSIAAMNLLRLSQLAETDDWRVKAEKTMRAFAELLQRSPFALPEMAAAFEFSTQKGKQIVIAGRRDDEATMEMVREIHRRYIPNKILILADGTEGQRVTLDVNAFAHSLTMKEGKATAYVCEDFVCRLPTTSVTELVKLLE